MEDNEDSAEEDDDSVFIIIDERLSAVTESENKPFNTIKANNISRIRTETVIEVETQTEKQDFKRVANTEKSYDRKEKVRQVTQDKVEANKSKTNIDNDDTIRLSIQEEIIHKNNETPMSFINLEQKIIEDALAKNKVKSDLSNEKKNKVLCICDEPSQHKNSNESLKSHEKRPGKRKNRGYGYSPKYVFFEEIEQAEPAGDILEYEDGNRNDFVRQVFLLCSIMLTVTFGITACSYFILTVRNMLRTIYGLMLLLCAGVGVLSVQYIYCCSNCSRVFPCNYILNTIVTLGFSTICSFLANRYDMVIVLTAAGTALTITFICLGLACTSFDFTRFILIVTVFVISFLIASVAATVIQFLIGYKLTIVRVTLIVISAVSGAVMMIIEFQMILSGHTVQIGDEDYTYGAYLIYTSSISIFIKLMGIINFIKNSEYD